MEASGNPTTILAGNNVLPVAIAKQDTGAVSRFPSSTQEGIQTVNRVLFEFLEAISQEVLRHGDGLFSQNTALAIRRGHFTVVRSQWCCYLPTDDVPRFLQFIAVLFGQTITTSDGVVDLASHLGLRFRIFTDRRTQRVTGVLFEKRHGKNAVFSLVLYDKRKRVAQMRQGKTLTDAERTLVSGNVRFDITAHGPGIMEIIAEARRLLKRLRKDSPKLFEELGPNFLSVANRLIGSSPRRP